MNRHVVTIATCVFATSLAMFAASPAAAQPVGPQGDTYATIVKLPDWSGIWVRPWADFEAENARRDENSKTPPKLTGEGIKAQEALKQLRSASASAASAAAPQAGTCAAAELRGVPDIMRFAFGMEFLFTPGRVTMLLEVGSTIRHIHTDGRRHSANPDPTYVGESVGHWEGDTLVVDTTAINEGVLLAQGIPSSGRMHVVERIRLIEPARLQIDTVVEDPVILREPWRARRIYERSTIGWFEQECESDRDGRDQEPDLTPPK